MGVVGRGETGGFRKCPLEKSPATYNGLVRNPPRQIPEQADESEIGEQSVMLSG